MLYSIMTDICLDQKWGKWGFQEICFSL